MTMQQSLNAGLLKMLLCIFLVQAGGLRGDHQRRFYGSETATVSSVESLEEIENGDLQCIVCWSTAAADTAGLPAVEPLTRVCQLRLTARLQAGIQSRPPPRV